MIVRILRAAKRIIIPVNGIEKVIEPNYGLKTGVGTNIAQPMRLEGKEYIQFGENCYMGSQAWLSAYDSYPYSNQKFTPQISIGNNVFIGDHCMITSINKIILEDGVEISHQVFISDHTHSTMPEENIPIRKRKLITTGYVKIGAYSAIGLRAVICQGVTLGKYCIVSANSVVTRSFPDYSLVRGNPAILIKTYSHEKKKWVEPDSSMKLKYCKS